MTCARVWSPWDRWLAAGRWGWAAGAGLGRWGWPLGLGRWGWALLFLGLYSVPELGKEHGCGRSSAQQTVRRMLAIVHGWVGRKPGTAPQARPVWLGEPGDTRHPQDCICRDLNGPYNMQRRALVGGVVGGALSGVLAYDVLWLLRVVLGVTMLLCITAWDVLTWLPRQLWRVLVAVAAFAWGTVVAFVQAVRGV